MPVFFLFLYLAPATVLMYFCRQNAFHTSNTYFSFDFFSPQLACYLSQFANAIQVGFMPGLWFLRITLCDSVSMALTACQCKD